MAKCKWEACKNEAKEGKKYCPACGKVAYQKWREMISNSANQKAEKEENFQKIWIEAMNAGLQAASMCKPVPMVVQQHANMLDDGSPVVKEYFVAGGPCGFAWVNINPATCSFVRWLKKHNIGHKSYYGGWEVSAGSIGNQSIQIKEAWAGAVARVLDENGIKVSVGSRLD